MNLTDSVVFSCHMFYPRRVLDINDGLPKWSGISGNSELVADTPVEHKHKKAKQDEEKKEKEIHEDGEKN